MSPVDLCPLNEVFGVGPQRNNHAVHQAVSAARTKAPGADSACIWFSA